MKRRRAVAGVHPSSGRHPLQDPRGVDEEVLGTYDDDDTDGSNYGTSTVFPSTLVESYEDSSINFNFPEVINA